MCSVMLFGCCLLGATARRVEFFDMRRHRCDTHKFPRTASLERIPKYIPNSLYIANSPFTYLEIGLQYSYTVHGSVAFPPVVSAWIRAAVQCTQLSVPRNTILIEFTDSTPCQTHVLQVALLHRHHLSSAEASAELSGGLQDTYLYIHVQVH